MPDAGYRMPDAGYRMPDTEASLLSSSRGSIACPAHKRERSDLLAIGNGTGSKVLFATLQNSREITSPIIQASAGLFDGFVMTGGVVDAGWL